MKRLDMRGGYYQGAFEGRSIRHGVAFLMPICVDTWLENRNALVSAKGKPHAMMHDGFPGSVAAQHYLRGAASGRIRAKPPIGDLIESRSLWD
jgi:hypothetical protein